MVPVVGLEPTRCRHQRILSPPRLPIPSHRPGNKNENYFSISLFELQRFLKNKAALRRIRIRINSLKRDLFAPGCVKNARKTLRVFLRFLPCRTQKSPLLRRFAVFGIRNGTDPGIIALSADLFCSMVCFCRKPASPYADAPLGLIRKRFSVDIRSFMSLGRGGLTCFSPPIRCCRAGVRGPP